MHAVLVSVSVDAEAIESAQATLRDQIVPTVAKEPGFVAGSVSYTHLTLPTNREV